MAMTDTITISKTLIEIIAGAVGLVIVTATGAFAFASMRSQLTIAAMQLKASENQNEFARKVQQNIDNNRVEIGRVKADVKSIKIVLARHEQIDYHIREGYDDADVPPHTDFK